MKVRNVKIHWENVYFLRMSENEKKRVRRRVVFYWRDLGRTDIIYKVLLQLEGLYESLFGVMKKTFPRVQLFLKRID